MDHITESFMITNFMVATRSERDSGDLMFILQPGAEAGAM